MTRCSQARLKTMQEVSIVGEGKCASGGGEVGGYSSARGSGCCKVCELVL